MIIYMQGETMPRLTFMWEYRVALWAAGASRVHLTLWGPSRALGSISCAWPILRVFFLDFASIFGAIVLA